MNARTVPVYLYRCPGVHLAAVAEYHPGDKTLVVTKDRSSGLNGRRVELRRPHDQGKVAEGKLEATTDSNRFKLLL